MCGQMEVGKTVPLAVWGCWCWCLSAPGLAMEGAIWRIAEEYGRAGLDRRRAFNPVPGSLQHARFWGAIMALQALWPGYLGIDNLDVVRFIARVLYHGRFTEPLCLWSKMEILFAHDACPGLGYRQGHQGEG